MDIQFSRPEQTAFEARFEAQKIAFGPVVFQCVYFAWQRGILQVVADHGEVGCSLERIAAMGKWSIYTLKVILESCLSAGVVSVQADHFVLDKIGYCILTDKLTQTNFKFVQDVCYQGMFELGQSLDTEKPVGLSKLGDWPTIYQGLNALPEPARSSWFAFDHLYSDTSFPSILPEVFQNNPTCIMDIGANTGKFAAAALAANDRVQLHLVDLPPQLELAKSHLTGAKLQERASFHPVDMLDLSQNFPKEMDLIWMSQFLSCFSESVIQGIFKRASEALSKRGQILVLDTFWDHQKHPIAAYCLINTSPYFTAMASGNSKVYRALDYVRLANAAHLKLVAERDGVGYCHSLLRFEKA